MIFAELIIMNLKKVLILCLCSMTTLGFCVHFFDNLIYKYNIGEKSLPSTHEKYTVNDFIEKRPKDREVSTEERYNILKELHDLNQIYSKVPLVDSDSDSHFPIKSQIVTFQAGNLPIYRFEFGNPNSQKRILIVSGCHAGTEPLSVITALKILKDGINQTPEQDNIYVVIYPLLNPWGFINAQRRSEMNIDYNRVFNLTEVKDKNMKEFIDSLKGERFNLALDLHGGPLRKAFFTIRNGDDQGLAERALKIFSDELLLPSESGNYPGFAHYKIFPDRYLLFSRGIAETKTPGTIKAFLAQYADFSYTLEYPGKMYRKDLEQMFPSLVYSFIQNLPIM